MTSTNKRNDNNKQLSQTSGSSSRGGVSTRNKASAEGTTPLPHHIITEGPRGKPKGLKQPSSNNNTARNDTINKPTTSTPRRDDSKDVKQSSLPSEVLFKEVSSKSPHSRPPTPAERDVMQGKHSYAAAAASTSNTSSNNRFGDLDRDSSVASSNSGISTPDNTNVNSIGRAGSIRGTTDGDLSTGDNNNDTSSDNNNTPSTNPNNTEGNNTNFGDAPHNPTDETFDDGRVDILDSSLVNTSLVAMVEQHDRALETIKRDINNIESRKVNSGFDDIKSVLRLLDEKIDSLRSDFNANTSTMDDKLLAMESKLDERVSAHTSTMDSKLSSLASRVDTSLAETASTLTATNTSHMEESKRLASQVATDAALVRHHAQVVEEKSNAIPSDAIVKQWVTDISEARDSVIAARDAAIAAIDARVNTNNNLDTSRPSAASNIQGNSGVIDSNGDSGDVSNMHPWDPNGGPPELNRSDSLNRFDLGIPSPRPDDLNDTTPPDPLEHLDGDTNAGRVRPQQQSYSGISNMNTSSSNTNSRPSSQNSPSNENNVEPSNPPVEFPPREYSAMEEQTLRHWCSTCLTLLLNCVPTTAEVEDLMDHCMIDNVPPTERDVTTYLRQLIPSPPDQSTTPESNRNNNSTQRPNGPVNCNPESSSRYVQNPYITPTRPPRDDRDFWESRGGYGARNGGYVNGSDRYINQTRQGGNTGNGNTGTTLENYGFRNRGNNNSTNRNRQSSDSVRFAASNANPPPAASSATSQQAHSVHRSQSVHHHQDGADSRFRDRDVRPQYTRGGGARQRSYSGRNEGPIADGCDLSHQLEDDDWDSSCQDDDNSSYRQYYRPRGDVGTRDTVVPISPRQVSAIEQNLGPSATAWLSGIYGSLIHGTRPLKEDMCTRLGVPSNGIQPLITTHHTAMLKLLTTTSSNRSGGPSTQKALKWDHKQLTMVNTHAFIKWYKELAMSCLDFGIPLTPFVAICIEYGPHGLIPAGMGVNWYSQCGLALMRLLPQLLPENNAAVQAHVQHIENGTSNGYELLWALSSVVLPIFDLSRSLPEPTWPESDDIMEFSSNVQLHRQLVRQRGQDMSEEHMVKMFVQGLQGPRYTHFRITLLSQLDLVSPVDPCDGSPPSEWRMPPQFRLEQLIVKIQQRSANVVSDSLNLGGRPYRRYQRRTTTGGTAGATANRVMAEDTQYCEDPYDSEDESSDDDDMYCLNVGTHLHGFVAYRMAQNRRPRSNDAREPNPAPRRGQEEQFEGTCPACGRWGHPAIRCHYLAMFVHCKRYLINASDSEKKECEKAWVERNKRWLNDDRTTPRRVARLYCKKLNLSEEKFEQTLVDELDWAYLDDGTSTSHQE